MFGLEVVRPEHPEVVLDEVGALLFDQDGPGLEDLVGGGVELLHDGFDRFGFDPRLGRVIDTARQVTVGVDGRRAAHAVEQGEQTRGEVHAWAPWLVIDD